MPTYSDETRDRAVRLSREGFSDASVASLLSDTGVTEETVRKWRNDAGIHRMSGQVTEVETTRGHRSGAIEVDNRTGQIRNQRGKW